MAIDRFRVLRAYLAARRYQSRRTKRASIERRQQKLWQAMAPVIVRTPALKDLAGASLDKFPIVRPEEIRQDFGRWNTLGLTSAAAHAAAAEAEAGKAGEVAPGVSAGFSTGTSGARGVFLASEGERAEYLGQALARLLPGDALLRRRRIALVLRADSALYRDVRNAGPFRFSFIKLGTPLSEMQQTLADFDPHVLVAPSHVLADLARAPVKTASLQHIFYGAEPMGAPERDWILSRLRIRPDPIYQATEGFLGAACRLGTLHLNEGTLIIERQPVPGTDHFQPIVTDLRRTTQPIVRVLLDDLLQPLQQVCPCGSPLTAVAPVEGRVGDLWRWDDVTIPPRDVELAMSKAVGADVDWRAIAQPAQVTIETSEEKAQLATDALKSLLQRYGLSILIITKPLGPMTGFKRRRVTYRNA